jgi:serine/threonine protein phosphatase PrpC
MEDAHIASLGFEGKTSIFGVFDGHGGKEVSMFVAKHFLD